MGGICALCKTHGDLQNSHIIPEFFYKQVYDPSPRRFRVISTDPSEPEHFGQKGLRERLLCKNCEQKLGRWENYAKRAFVDGKGVRILEQKDSREYYDLDYKMFKLFQLSLLWRMSVSTVDFFTEVKLGPHEEKLRLALFNEDLLQPQDYPCVLIMIKIGGEFIPDWITKPSQSRYEHYHVYWLIISGILYVFFVGSHPPPESIVPRLLDKQNKLTVWIDDSRNYSFLRETLMEFGKAIADRKKAT